MEIIGIACVVVIVGLVIKNKGLLGGKNSQDDED